MSLSKLVRIDKKVGATDAAAPPKKVEKPAETKKPEAPKIPQGGGKKK